MGSIHFGHFVFKIADINFKKRGKQALKDAIRQQSTKYSPLTTYSKWKKNLNPDEKNFSVRKIHESFVVRIQKQKSNWSSTKGRTTRVRLSTCFYSFLCQRVTAGRQKSVAEAKMNGQIQGPVIGYVSQGCRIACKI